MVSFAVPIGLAAVALAVLSAPLAAAGGARADGAAGGPLHVAQAPAAAAWCYEPERDLVRRKSAAQCLGELVPPAKARSLRAKRDERIRRAVAGPKPVFPGLARRGSGGGIVVSRGGHVLTNRHVMANCRAVSVVPFGRKEVAAKVIAEDVRADLALLAAPIRRPAVAAFAADPPLRPADPVAVVGYPNLGKIAIRPVLASGHVFIGGDAGRADRYVLKADVRPGNSGSPVLDRSARVVGVVVAQLDTPTHYALTGRLLRHVGIAIRPETAIRFLRRYAVEPVTRKERGDLDDATLLTRAQSFVARIGCWR